MRQFFTIRRHLNQRRVLHTSRRRSRVSHIQIRFRHIRILQHPLIPLQLRARREIPLHKHRHRQFFRLQFTQSNSYTQLLRVIIPRVLIPIKPYKRHINPFITCCLVVHLLSGEILHKPNSKSLALLLLPRINDPLIYCQIYIR